MTEVIKEIATGIWSMGQIAVTAFVIMFCMATVLWFFTSNVGDPFWLWQVRP